MKNKKDSRFAPCCLKVYYIKGIQTFYIKGQIVNTNLGVEDIQSLLQLLSSATIEQKHS